MSAGEGYWYCCGRTIDIQGHVNTHDIWVFWDSFSTVYNWRVYCVGASNCSRIMSIFVKSRKCLPPLIYLQCLLESVNPSGSCGVNVSTSISYASVVAAAAVEGEISIGIRCVIVSSSIGSSYLFSCLSSAMRSTMYLDTWERFVRSLLYWNSPRSLCVTTLMVPVSTS